MSRKSIYGVAAAFILSATAAFLFVLPAPARDATAPAPAIWKVDGPNGHLYLFGSIHILPKDYVWRTPELEAALDAAQQLVFEINIDEAQDPILSTSLIGKLGLLPPGQSLHKMIAPELRERFDTAARVLGLDPAAMDHMRPWLAAITLSSVSIVKQNTKPGDPKPNTQVQMTLGVDFQLWNWAKAAKKDRGALETVEDQLRVFADLTSDEQVAFLVVTLEEVTKTSTAITTLLQAWRAGDTATLDRELNAGVDRFPSLSKAIMHDRHVKWLPQIERMLGDGRTHLIIVGAAHLVGKDSVIAMLRARGIQVQGP